LLRDGKPLRVTAVIADTTAELSGGPASIHKSFEGAVLGDAPDAGGALVRSVEPGSAAAQAGLRAEDVIVGANRGRVSSVHDLRERARGAAVLLVPLR
jgi:serine protease DegQ